MAADNTLIFEGTRWQAANATWAGYGNSALWWISTGGRGRSWRTRVTQGFWRTFAETVDAMPHLDRLDGNAVLDIEAFVRRYGDPYGRLSENQPVQTGDWKQFSGMLEDAARGWEPEDADGVSRFTTDPERIRLTERALFAMPMEESLLEDVEPILDRVGHTPRIVWRAKTLAAFMCVSALRAVERRVPMRRCAHCEALVRNAPGRRAILLGFLSQPSLPATTKGSVMASVHRRRLPSGTVIYTVKWREPGPGGKPRQRTKNFQRAADAKAHASQVGEERERRGVGDSGRHTLAGYMKRWLATLADRGEHSPATIAGYIRQSEVACAHIGHIPLEKVSPADLDQLYATLLRRGGRAHEANADGTRGTRPLKASSVLFTHRVLRAALERARKWKLIAENPARDASPPSPRKSPVKAFTVAQVGQLLAAARRDAETHCMTALFLTCGIRRSELLGIALDAFDADAGTIEIKRTVIEVRGRIDSDTRTVTKQRETIVRDVMKSDSSARVIALPAPMVELLREQKARVLAMALKWGKGYQREPMFLFPGLAGAPMQPQDLTYRMRAVMRRAKVVGPSPCHAWRHTSATQLLDGGQNIKTVQTRLGHSSPAMTLSLYVHPVTERDREAADHLGSLLKP